MPNSIKLESVSDKEYKQIMGIYKVLSIVSVTTLAGGLAGLALKHFGVPGSSALVHEIFEYSKPAAMLGGISTLYSGLVYWGNKALNTKSNEIEYSLKN